LPAAPGLRLIDERTFFSTPYQFMDPHRDLVSVTNSQA
jgi:hypothetical protein